MYDNRSELKHYGVLGMKWGVRRNPSKAYKKATKEHSRRVARGDEYAKKAKDKRINADVDEDLSRREQATADDYKAKAAKHQSQADQHRANAKQARIDADDLDLEAQRAYRDGENWLKLMNDTFKDYNINAIKKQTFFGERWEYEVTPK